jgi:hypothetical protein
MQRPILPEDFQYLLHELGYELAQNLREQGESSPASIIADELAKAIGRVFFEVTANAGEESRQNQLIQLLSLTGARITETVRVLRGEAKEESVATLQ